MSENTTNSQEIYNLLARFAVGDKKLHLGKGTYAQCLKHVKLITDFIVLEHANQMLPWEFSTEYLGDIIFLRAKNTRHAYGRVRLWVTFSIKPEKISGKED